MLLTWAGSRRAAILSRCVWPGCPWLREPLIGTRLSNSCAADDMRSAPFVSPPGRFPTRLFRVLTALAKPLQLGNPTSPPRTLAPPLLHAHAQPSRVVHGGVDVPMRDCVPDAEESVPAGGIRDQRLGRPDNEAVQVELA